MKILLLCLAILIAISTLWYTQKMVEDLSIQEKHKIELWAEATKQIVSSNPNDNISFLLKVIENNNTIPVIVANADQQLVISRNVDSAIVNNPAALARALESMKEQYEPIRINLPNNKYQYIYYERSSTLKQLNYYPYIQLGVIVVFILVAYLAFSSSRKAEQNKVWTGLSKETAHQLGTPISSLMAWTEVFKAQMPDKELVMEFSKDVYRLEKIAERFSKIGSKPKLDFVDLQQVLHASIAYLNKRLSNKINFVMNFPKESIKVKINISLFEWVVENLCKNAVDAMGGVGTITLSTEDMGNKIALDIMDEGKGLSKSKFRSIFKPGYTTKERGWGLGLSLTKRIVEDYHKGRIFVHASEIGHGTTFRIILDKHN